MATLWRFLVEVPNQGAQVAAFGFVPLIHCSLVVHTSIFTFTKAIVGVLAFAAQIRCGMEHKRARTGTRFQKWCASECINDQWRSNLFVEISNFHAYKIVAICRFDINQRSRRPSSPNSRARSPPPRAGVSQPSCMPHASTVTRVKYAPCFYQGRGGSLPSPKDKRHHVYATWARSTAWGRVPLLFRYLYVLRGLKSQSDASQRDDVRNSTPPIP